jgi:hypothetical protein
MNFHVDNVFSVVNPFKLLTLVIAFEHFRTKHILIPVESMATKSMGDHHSLSQTK